MTNDTQPTEGYKRCKNGANCVQSAKYPDGVMPIGEFHPKYSKCKKCHSRYTWELKQSGNGDPKRSRDKLIGESSMDAVIYRLGQNGIYAVRGRESSFNHVDIVAWGCVRVEVKSATSTDGRWSFHFGNQTEKGIKGDLVVLVALDENAIPVMYSVFPSNFHVFYKAGKLKSSVILYARPVKRKMGHTPLTMQDMEAHEDAWYQIEEVRERVSNQLKHGIYQPKRVNKPADKPMPLFDKVT
jgi:hypothetical protein